MNMSTLMKTMIASVLAVAVTGPAMADVKENGTFIGDSGKFKITVQGCKNFSINKRDSVMMFEDDSEYPESGYWYLGAFFLGKGGDIDGMYIERKVGKDLTLSMDYEDLGMCAHIDNVPELALECTGIAEAIQAYLIEEDCGLMTAEQSHELTITKGQVKLSRDGDTAKVDIKVEGVYGSDDKKVTFQIKSAGMDFVDAPAPQ